MRCGHNKVGCRRLAAGLNDRWVAWKLRSGFGRAKLYFGRLMYLNTKNNNTAPPFPRTDH